MKQQPIRQKPVIGTNKETGDTVYFQSAYYAPGFKRAGIKEAISGRAKSHRSPGDMPLNRNASSLLSTDSIG